MIIDLEREREKLDKATAKVDRLFKIGQWEEKLSGNIGITGHQVYARDRDKILNPDMTGLRFPWFHAKDKILVRKGKLAIWTGYTHHGKSTILKQIMLSAMLQGEKVMLLSFEEEAHEVMEQFSYLYRGKETLTETDHKKTVEAIGDKIIIVDTDEPLNHDQIMGHVQSVVEIHGVDQVIIDPLMMVGVKKDDYQGQMELLRNVRGCAKQNKFTAHVVAHMRKSQLKAGDGSPGNIHDIAGGHEIGSISDYIFNVWRNRKPEEDQPHAFLIVEKQRGRPKFIGGLPLDVDGPSGQFVERGRGHFTYGQ